MTPSSAHSPVNKMAQPQRTSSQDSTSDSIRKRVCKACDRCRLKKSKCDGASPCTRCKADNAICVFGERKKSHDKVYPKGYVEMLEQQQGQLVSGLQEMYRQLLEASAWKGSPLSETNGNPLTHDILSALNLLETRQDGETETFEEDCQKLQSRLLAEGAGYTQQRRGSCSSESDHSQHSHARSQSRSTPTLSKPAVFEENLAFGGSERLSPPAAQSPAHPQRLSYTSAAQPSPLQHSSPLVSDPQLFQAEWAYPDTTSSYAIRSDFAIQTPGVDTKLNDLNGLPWETSSAPFDQSMAAFTSYPIQMANGFGDGPRLHDGAIPAFQPEEMDFQFNQYISGMA